MYKITSAYSNHLHVFQFQLHPNNLILATKPLTFIKLHFLKLPIILWLFIMFGSAGVWSLSVQCGYYSMHYITIQVVYQRQGTSATSNSTWCEKPLVNSVSHLHVLPKGFEKSPDNLLRVTTLSSILFSNSIFKYVSGFEKRGHLAQISI